MRALICREWGDIGRLKVEDVAAPKPGAGQVLIDVKATAVNYADAIMVAGRYQTKPPLPFSPGLETAGVVVACGDGVTRFAPGDRVMAILAYGGLAEMAVADAAVSALGWGGRILLVGFVGGVQQIAANRLLVKHRAALGSSLRYFRWHAPDKLQRSVDELLRWYAEGKLRPLITQRVPLERAIEAIRLLTDRKGHGKLGVLPEEREMGIRIKQHGPPGVGL